MRIQTSFLGTLTLVTLALLPLTARAETTEVSTTGKGLVGGSRPKRRSRSSQLGPTSWAGSAAQQPAALAAISSSKARARA